MRDGAPYANFFERFHDAYVAELNAYIAHVLGRIPNPSPAEDALEALYVAEAAERSRALHQPMRLDAIRCELT